MATGHFYKTDADAGAPSLDNTAGSLISVLDWVLDVSGATHWEKVYTGTNKAAYRATAGERYYLRVDDTIGSVARFEAYETMSDVDTGTNPFPGTGTDYGYLAIPKNDSGTGTAYHAVGDSRYFMFITNFDPSYTYLHQMMAFGEANPYDSADSYSTIVMGSNHDSTNPSWNNWVAHGWVSDSWTLATNPVSAGGDAAALYLCNSPDGLSPGLGGRIAEHGYCADEPANPRYNDSPAVVMFPVSAYAYSGMTSSSTNPVALRHRIPYWYSSPLRIGGSGLNNLDVIQDGTTEYLAVTRGVGTTVGETLGKPAFIRISDDEPGRV